MTNIHPLSQATFAPRAVALPGDVIKVCDLYLRTQAGRGFSQNTLKAYYADLAQFAGYCLQRGVQYVQHITPQLLDDFVDALINGEGNKPRTAARKREAVKGMLNYCLRKELIARNPVTDCEAIRYITEPTIAPTHDELLNVIRAIPTDTLIGIRDRAFFRLMFDAALRVQGVIDLDVFNDKHPPRNAVWPNNTVVFDNKGGKVHSNPIDDITRQYLDAWLAVRHRWAHSTMRALFVSNRGTRITRHAMAARCKVYGQRAGLPDLHLHLFRHRRTGDVLETLGVRAAQSIAKHKDVRTTLNVYGHHTDAHTHQLLKQHCPLGE